MKPPHGWVGIFGVLLFSPIPSLFAFVAAWGGDQIDSDQSGSERLVLQAGDDNNLRALERALRMRIEGGTQDWGRSSLAAEGSRRRCAKQVDTSATAHQNGSRFGATTRRAQSYSGCTADSDANGARVVGGAPPCVAHLRWASFAARVAPPPSLSPPPPWPLQAVAKTLLIGWGVEVPPLRGRSRHQEMCAISPIIVRGLGAAPGAWRSRPHVCVSRHASPAEGI